MGPGVSRRASRRSNRVLSMEKSIPNALSSGTRKTMCHTTQEDMIWNEPIITLSSIVGTESKGSASDMSKFGLKKGYERRICGRPTRTSTIGTRVQRAIRRGSSNHVTRPYAEESREISLIYVYNTKTMNLVVSSFLGNISSSNVGPATKRIPSAGAVVDKL